MPGGKMKRLALTIALLITLTIPSFTTNAQGRTIAQIAAADSRFTTLVAALNAAGLVDALNGPGQLTVFAPTNAAFAALPPGTIEALLADIPTLTSILTYHVVPGAVPASTVVNLSSATTLQGSDVLISVRDGGVVLNGSVNVIITDIQASNGIIHVIDAVLLPPTTGLRDLRLVTGNTQLLTSPSGNASGEVVRTCQTVLITRVTQNFGFASGFNGWVDLRSTVDVAETYGQPNGQAITPGCEGR
jgi:uncharacterized surface protein with fasciclin (FAS1) repeats